MRGEETFEMRRLPALARPLAIIPVASESVFACSVARASTPSMTRSSSDVRVVSDSSFLPRDSRSSSALAGAEGEDARSVRAREVYREAKETASEVVDGGESETRGAESVEEEEGGVCEEMEARMVESGTWAMSGVPLEQWSSAPSLRKTKSDPIREDGARTL